MKRLLLILALACTGLAALGARAAAEDDLLSPEQAFRVNAVPTAQGLRLEWTIADGYYLYRSKFRFTTDDGRVTLGTPAFPAGKVKQDEFFGPMEIYRHQMAVDLPVTHAAAVPGLTLKATSQGCADLGVCYPPYTQTLTVDLPAPSEATADGSGGPGPAADLASSLGFGGEANAFLPADQAFHFYGELSPEGSLVATWEIAPGYYLYKSRFKFSLITGAGVSLGTPELPAGQAKDDPQLGHVEVYHDRVQARVPVHWTAAGKAEVSVGYQGCAEAGICYPPMTQTVSLTLPAPAPAAAQAAPTSPAPAAGQPQSEQDRLAALLGQDRWMAILAFFGFGLLLAFTPCVFPMIPILSGIIVGQGSQITARRAFVLSLTYVLAMSVTYTVAGIIAGKFGHNLQAALQNPWVLGTFAGIFVLLALSMFGFYDLQLPSTWQSRLTELSNRQRGGTLIGVAIMGLLSALIVGPCVAPPLAGALIYIGQTGDPWLGGVALFSLSLGMGAPLVIMGTLEGRYLPRAGGWMNAVKGVFGVALLGVAIFLLDRVLPAWLILLLWAGLFMVSAIYMGALEPLGKDAGGFRKLWKGLGLVLLVYGVLLMIGAASGGGDMLQPLRGTALAGAVSTDEGHGLPFRPVKGPDELEADLAAAAARGQPVMLDYYADWCVSCKELEKFTFSDPGVQQAVSAATLLRADVTANDERDQALLRRYELIGPPAVLFFGPDGRERRGYRLVGFLDADRFKAHATEALR